MPAPHRWLAAPGSGIILVHVIAKEKTPQRGQSPMEKAGDDAERQMAFYLRRRYADNPKVQIFNDLRVERQGEVAQMDHLILHRHGMIVVESKSVTGEVRINEQLEFVRVFNGRPVGMPSPIQQARRQGDLLRQMLLEQKEQLRNKVMLGLVQGGFASCPIQILVAISDQGIIRRPTAPVPELHKADQIVDQVEAIMDRHRRAAKLFARSDGDWGNYTFEDSELERVTAFLVSRHVEARPAPSEPASASGASRARATPTASREGPLPSYRCSHCRSPKLEVSYGHSYYFKCLDCSGNTVIANHCERCGGPAKTKKRGAEHFAVCDGCNTEQLFFRNTATQTR